MIFEHCIESGSDFYEMESGNLFHISIYADMVKMGVEPEGIIVSDGFGNCTGIVPGSKVNDIIRRNNLHPKWIKEN